jgi:hypothetical protein
VIANIELRPTGYKTLLEVLSRGVYRRAVEIAYTFQEPNAIRQRVLGATRLPSAARSRSGIVLVGVYANYHW